jgi:hypothetical protein
VDWLGFLFRFWLHLSWFLALFGFCLGLAFVLFLDLAFVSAFSLAFGLTGLGFCLALPWL